MKKRKKKLQRTVVAGAGTSPWHGRGRRTLECETCTQNLSAKKINYNSPQDPRSGKLRSWKEVEDGKGQRQKDNML